MEKSAKRKVLVMGSLLVMAGVGGYFLWRYLKKKKEGETPKLDEGVVPGTTTTPGSTTTTPFSSAEDVKKFQDWMDLKHPNWVKGKNLNKGGGYGTFGPSTQKAWASFGSEYTTKTPAVVTTQSSLANLRDVLAGDINGANGKKIFADLSNLPVRNMNSEKVGVTTKNQELGTVVSAKAVQTSASTSYLVTFTDANGVKYRLGATGIKVQL